MNIRKIVKMVIPMGLFRKIEPYGHLAEAVFFNAVYGFPARNMKVIGITGTNGKTTTTFLVQRMLHEAGYSVGLMTTVAYGIGSDIRPQVHHMTNVPVPELMKRLRWMKRQGVEWLVQETTSQALVQNRVWCLPYSVAVLTNITHEHLDYHGTFENYRDAKKLLFSRTNKNKHGLQTGIINADDPACEIFAAAIDHPMTYGMGPETKGQLRAEGVELSSNGVQYTARMINSDAEGDSKTAKKQKMLADEYRIVCNLPGSFNVANSLAAVGVGRALGLTKEQIEQGIAALDGVEGRMTRISEGQSFNVIVDFAHTPDSFEKLFKDLRPVVKGRLIVMFGSAGRRDEAKRPLQGALAGKYADEVIITEEDDRDADGKEIMEQIAAGAIEAGKERDLNLFVVHNRVEAINFAIGRADTANDTILLLGKGHEKTIERANGENPWDEIGTAHDALRRLLGDAAGDKSNSGKSPAKQKRS
jgi:UDP-N-acetylmuramoyl-L-alanyl-D-glutamate--2,6-diaminopimelate ligase